MVDTGQEPSQKYIVIYPQGRPVDEDLFRYTLSAFAAAGVHREYEYDLTAMKTQMGGDDAALKRAWRDLRAFWFGKFTSWTKIFAFRFPYGILTTTFDPVEASINEGHVFPPEITWGEKQHHVLILSDAPKGTRLKLAEGSEYRTRKLTCVLIVGRQPVERISSRLAAHLRHVALPPLLAEPPLVLPPPPTIATSRRTGPDAQAATTRPAVPYLVRATQPPASPRSIADSPGRYSSTDQKMERGSPLARMPSAGSSHPPPHRSGAHPAPGAVPAPDAVKTAVNESPSSPEHEPPKTRREKKD